MYWEGVCANFVVQSSIGTCFAQALEYKVVLGSASCKLCSTKYFEKVVLCKYICIPSIWVQKFSPPRCFLCKRLLSDNKSFLACKTAKMGRGYKWANALVPPTPFSGRSGGERSKRPTCAVVQTCKYYRVFEGLGSVNIDCGTMNRMYWYQVAVHGMLFSYFGDGVSCLPCVRRSLRKEKAHQKYASKQHSINRHGNEGFQGFKAFKGWQTAGLDAHKKPLMCGLGVPVGCRMKHGKRQAWTPMTGCKF